MATNNAINVGTAATGKVLQGQGVGTSPAFSTATYPSTAGTSGKVLISDGTNIVSSTPTYPNASATSRKIIVSDGTNFVASTETWATPSTSGNILNSDGTNWVSSTPGSVGASLYLINTLTASSSSPTITSGITSTYRNYLIVFSNVTFTTGGDKMTVVFSTDGGSSYLATGYTSGSTSAAYNSTTLANNNGTTFVFMSNAGGTSTPGTSGYMYLYELATGNKVTFSGGFTTNAATPTMGWTGGTSTTTTVNALKFSGSTNTLATGTIKIYGML